ncbi:MAG: hypothetical protein KDD49_11015 [Bacteroidetes bacterium]|nr:hypothetical protein [Bacteroidota bacterium]MCB9044112.1 hypothetical protein [Chitinophagales bacterium]
MAVERSVHCSGVLLRHVSYTRLVMPNAKRHPTNFDSLTVNDRKANAS